MLVTLTIMFPNTCTTLLLLLLLLLL